MACAPELASQFLEYLFVGWSAPEGSRHALGSAGRLPENVMVRHPADLVVAVPARVFRRPEPGLLVGDLDFDAAAGSDVKYLSLPHSCAVRGVRVVAEGDDLPRWLSWRALAFFIPSSHAREWGQARCRLSPCSLPPPVNERTGAQLGHLNGHTTAACLGLPTPVEHLDRKHARGAYDAGARPDFCHLQGIVIARDFWVFRWRSSVSTQECFPRTSFAKFAHSTPRRAVARAAPCAMRNRLPAGRTIEPASSGVHAGCLTPLLAAGAARC